MYLVTGLYLGYVLKRENVITFKWYFLFDRRFYKSLKQKFRSIDEIQMVINKKFKVKRKTKNVLEQLRFECKQGDVVGLIGSSGSGKTTLCNILEGKLLADHGSEILINGVKKELAYNIHKIAVSCP